MSYYEISCPHCHNSIPATTKVCPECGVVLETGEEYRLPDDPHAYFTSCPKCGVSLGIRQSEASSRIATCGDCGQVRLPAQERVAEVISPGSGQTYDPFGGSLLLLVLLLLGLIVVAVVGSSQNDTAPNGGAPSANEKLEGVVE